MIRVRQVRAMSQTTAPVDYRYGETTAPLPRDYPALVRWDDAPGDLARVDSVFLETRPWAEGRVERCVATIHPDGLWGCGCSECRLLQAQANDQARHDNATEEG